ncbi:MAG: lytic transglycosylase domain-containing protein [Leptospiraceae bacterium]|nr:lytic transglycosylase domain-containing protein [Leptospiraceae bacterium]MCB1323129.1 lytic transglycosylase domain-containing protein [Leptospiraceae bacterium]
MKGLKRAPQQIARMVRELPLLLTGKGLRFLLLPCFLVWGVVQPISLQHRAEIHQQARAEVRTEQRLRVLSFIESRNPRIDRLEKQYLVDTIMTEAERLQFPVEFEIDGSGIESVYFLTALISVESTFQRKVVSSADARGYMQLMPATVAWMDERLVTRTHTARLFETDTNIKRGVTYLNMLAMKMDDIRTVCLAYNAGPGNVRRGFWVEEYWLKVLAAYREIQKGAFLTHGSSFI